MSCGGENHDEKVCCEYVDRMNVAITIEQCVDHSAEEDQEERRYKLRWQDPCFSSSNRPTEKTIDKRRPKQFETVRIRGQCENANLTVIQMFL